MAIEVKDVIAFTMSGIALGLSGFTLWWTNFWKRVGLVYVETDPMCFALVNTGKTDILVREVKFWFVGSSPNAGMGPPQDTGIGKDKTTLLKAGTAMEVSVKWLEELPWRSMRESGRPTEWLGNAAAEFTLWVTIGWIDSWANMHISYVMAGVTVIQDQRFVSWRPGTLRQDLMKPSGKKFAA